MTSICSSAASAVVEKDIPTAKACVFSSVFLAPPCPAGNNITCIDPVCSSPEEDQTLLMLKNHKFCSWNLPKEEFPLTDAKLAEFHKQCFPTKRPIHPKQLYQNTMLFLDIGTAKFYKAIRKSDNQSVMIKKIRNRTDAFEQSFVENEAILSLLCTFGPNMLTYFDTHSTKKNTWLVMEFVEGCTIKELSTIVEFKESHIAYITKQVLESILWMHERQRAHRDLKNQNVMVRKDMSIALMDFGYAIQYTQEKTCDNLSVGSLLYMAPEVAMAESYKFKPDIWSLGIMVFELLCGEPPLAGCATVKDTVASLVSPEDTPRVPAYRVCSDALRDFIHQCLVYDPTRRVSAQSLMHHPFMQLACTPAEWKTNIRVNVSSWPNVFEDAFTN